MKLKVQGSKSEVDFNDEAFGSAYNEPLVHQVVTAYMATGRAATKAQKTRAEKRGGGTKPWRQKGTGRARVGSIRNPIWVNGGRAFAARPDRDFSQKVNRKMYRGAMRSMLSELVRQQRLVLVDEFGVSEAKTKELVGKLKALELDNTLVVVEGFDEKLLLAARNLPHVEVEDASSIDPVSLLRHEKVLMTVAAARLLEEKLV